MAGNKATRNSASSSVLPDTPDLSRISLSEVQASLAYSAQGLGDTEVLARLNGMATTKSPRRNRIRS